MSSNGSNDSTCGDTDTACRTLECVLYLYYNTPSHYGPEIITDKSLTFDQHLMVRLLFHSNLSIHNDYEVKFTSMHSSFHC